MKSLTAEVNKIINNIDSSWTYLEKTRYVYIEVGKIIEKNTEFFFTQEAKLRRNALSDEEMRDIYNNIPDLNEIENKYKVICRSAHVLMKIILDMINIPSHLVRTTRYTNLSPTDDTKVYHWFLSVDIDNTHYFLTITGDIHNIKNNFATEHFATDIAYRDSKGNAMYDGEELEYTQLTYEQLLNIDKKIGYVNTGFRHKKSNNTYLDYHNQVLREINSNLNEDNKWYYEVIIHNSEMYRNMFTIVDGNGQKSYITALDNKTIFEQYHMQLIKNVCYEVEKNLKHTLGIDLPTYKFIDYHSWLKNICNMLYEELIDTYGNEYDYLIKVPNIFDYKLWRTRQKKKFKCPYKFYDDYLLLLDQVNSYVEMINTIHDNYESEIIDEKVNKKIRNLRILHEKIVEHFLPDIVVFEKNLEMVNDTPYIKSDYINEKFKTMFPIIFGVANGPQEFNQLGYSEQIATINKMLLTMFGELTEDNCSQAPGYTFFCRPTLNRIRTYSLFNEETQSYELVIHIPSFFDFEDEYYYKYELKENKFSQIDIIEDVYYQKKYEILSVTLRKRLKNIKNTQLAETIEEIEDIERIR
ncbi:MAG: hypothetical protein J1F35_01340 [Erysipelotrichales bacterium]|nr:hypothetical protein [Erysipelotrichales bacterium]